MISYTRLWSSSARKRGGRSSRPKPLGEMSGDGSKTRHSRPCRDSMREERGETGAPGVLFDGITGLASPKLSSVRRTGPLLTITLQHRLT
jgi:hypothetical protein